MPLVYFDNTALLSLQGPTASQIIYCIASHSAAQVQSSKDRTNSSSLSKDVLLQGHHPLKLRVKELMKQRCSDPCVLPTNRKVCNILLPPTYENMDIKMCEWFSCKKKKWRSMSLVLTMVIN